MAFLQVFFYDKFSSPLEQLAVSPENSVIVGDFNFHVDDHSNIQARRFLALFDNFDLKQLVSQSTHERGNTLDLIITRSDEADFFLRDIYACYLSFSNHSSILFKLDHHKSSGQYGSRSG